MAWGAYSLLNKDPSRSYSDLKEVLEKVRKREKMKLSPLVLGTLSSVHGLSVPGWNNFINSAQRTWFNIFNDVMGEGEHPSVLCVDEDAEITTGTLKIHHKQDLLRSLESSNS